MQLIFFCKLRFVPDTQVVPKGEISEINKYFGHVADPGPCLAEMQGLSFD